MLRATHDQSGESRIRRKCRSQASATDDVLLRIRRIGICGSDIHVYHGKHPYTSYPVVQGHEFCGEVAETGASVQRFKPGDLVTAPPQIVCGQCLPCREGRYHICENLKVIGFQAPGVAQEFFCFPGIRPAEVACRFHSGSRRAGGARGGGDPRRRPRRKRFRARRAGAGCGADREPGGAGGAMAGGPADSDFRRERPPPRDRPAMRNSPHVQSPRGMPGRSRGGGFRPESRRCGL